MDSHGGRTSKPSMKWPGLRTATVTRSECACIRARQAICGDHAAVPLKALGAGAKCEQHQSGFARYQSGEYTE